MARQALRRDGPAMNPFPGRNTPLPGAPLAARAAGQDFTLHSDLARLCLPGEYKDTNRHLAWANSICALFLAIGVVGIKPPHLVVRELARPDDIVPVIFTQPEEVQPSEPEPNPEDVPPASPLEQSPVIATVVAVDSPAVAFAVPVKGPTILAPARFAAPPPPQTGNKEAPRFTRFNPGAGDRSTPQPDYPRLALQRGYQGTVIITFTVEPSGEISKAEVTESSGFTMLDEEALNTVRKRWRFAPGPPRYHFVPIVFQLK